jgi:hypothetical protein
MAAVKRKSVSSAYAPLNRKLSNSIHSLQNEDSDHSAAALLTVEGYSRQKDNHFEMSDLNTRETPYVAGIRPPEFNRTERLTGNKSSHIPSRHRYRIFWY